MGLMSEYIARRMSAKDLEEELLGLIKQYNDYRGTNLLVMASAVGKPIPDIVLTQEDFYMIADMLSNPSDVSKVDIYLETPGGSGEAAEEIVEFIREKYDYVSFVVSGEAKSAGTIMVLSGDDILMTKTGSLGPIDAQVRIGRSTISAFDYMEWVKDKHQEADKQGRLNPFDATMVAQISPGELKGVNHSLLFAEDLVGKWLQKYKFKHWKITETRKASVTDTMKAKRAKEIAQELTNHSKWRSHGRSIKIEDLEEIGLRITEVDKDEQLRTIVYKIQTVCRLLFNSTHTYKIFATDKEKIFKSATPVLEAPRIPQKAQVPEVVEAEVKCTQCGKGIKIYAKLSNNPAIDQDFQRRGFVQLPRDNKVRCDCGFEIDLGGLRNEIELKTGLKVVD
ncbi:ATP-dependent Clp protease proteolytic subunit [bacterium]|nr:ATP-dependent Clp protease proteolytic subunit [bacterium]